MKDVLTLLKPRFLSFRNRGLSKTRKGRGLRILLLSTIGLAFWSGTFIILYRVLTYFQRMESFGDILAYKLLSMALITFFSLLIFSSILTSLSKLYLSKDLALVHSMPVSRGKIFLARWMESTLDSSWMVLIFSLPLFLSYGIVYKTGVFYYAMVSLNLLPFCLMASSLSVLAVMVVALLLPAGRIRGVFVFLGLFLFLLLVVVFRLIRPEKFVNPESLTPFIIYLRTMDSSHSAWLPTTWFFDTLRASLTGAAKDAFFHSSLSWSFAISLIFITTWASGVIYFKGLSKAQVVPRRLFTSRRLKSPMEGFPFRFLSGPVRAFTTKEIKVFLRDQTQWSQIFLVGALIVIYLYNFSVLPLEQSSVRIAYLQNVLSFLNIALAAFVLAAVSARFVFPAVSQEGEAFWIVRSSPISIRTFLWIKFFVYFLTSSHPFRGVDRGDEPPSSCNSFDDGPFGPDDLLYGSRDRFDGFGSWRDVSGFSGRESSPVRHEPWRSHLHDPIGGFRSSRHCTGGRTGLFYLYERGPKGWPEGCSVAVAGRLFLCCSDSLSDGVDDSNEAG